MHTKKISWRGHHSLLALLAFVSTCYFIASCNSGGSLCTNPWGTWSLTFAAGISSDEKNTEKSIFLDSIKAYLGRPDSLGNTCTVSGYTWTDNNETTSELAVCTSCKDKDNN